MRRPPVVSVVGRSGSGKTTLLVSLIACLTTRGFRCGAMKSSHHRLDVEGKDTHRLAAAGACAVVGLGADGAVLSGVSVGIQEALELLPPRVDLVLAEGVRSPLVGWFIVIGDDPRPVPGPVMAHLAAVDEASASSLADTIASEVLLCPRDPPHPWRKQTMVELSVNGHPIPLNQFVSRLLEAQLRATVATLRDIPEDVREIVVRVLPSQEESTSQA